MKRPPAGLPICPMHAAAGLALVVALPTLCGATEQTGAHPYGAWSLAPPVVAVVLAIATRRIIVSLAVAVFAGALVTAGGNFPRAVADFAEIHLWDTLIEPDRLRLFAFVVAMGATIGVIYAGGGMRGLVSLLEPLARSRRSGQLVAWFAGLLIFFDDYANTLLLGHTFRPTFDRLKMSREKLAFVVDSTSAPVAGLALISTWIAVELDYLESGIQQLEAARQAGLSKLDLFIACLPYRFYVIQALVFVPLVALMGREFGPMLRAERRRLEVDSPLTEDLTEQPTELEMRPISHWSNAVVPLTVLLGVVMWLIVLTGLDSLQAEARAAQAQSPANEVAIPQLNWSNLRQVFGASESSLALQYGGLAGLVVAILLARVNRLLSMDQCLRAAGIGARMMIPALVILWFASGLSCMTTDESYTGEPSTAYEHQDHRLYTGQYLVDGLRHLADDPQSSAWLMAGLPTIVFLISGVVSFCTGTSFGTMGLMVPMVIPLAAATLDAAGVPLTPDNPILLAAVGSVLAGSIFGDHCSPLSDTTILSSQASGCDHVAHVNTQLPYALAVAAVTIALGTLAVGMGVSVWVLLPVQTLALIGLLWIFGKRVEG